MEKTQESRIKVIIGEKLGVTTDKLTPEASFVDDLGADSLDLVEMVMAFEDEFDIVISDQDAETLKTVQHALNYLNAKI